jgi:DNA-binding MarR family transcriptional regulator
LSSQVLTNQASALEAWVRLLRGHASATRAMSAQLVAEHGLTINDYECLLYLAHAEEGRVRRVDLAEQLILTASGVTRLLDGLEQAGWVERASCASDRRVTYAVLTDAGRAKLQEAADSHIAGVRTFFEERFSADEIETLARLLARLPGAGEAVDEASCSG